LTALHDARAALGWSQPRAVQELIRQAKARGLTLTNPSSLKTQLSRWENGHVVPEAMYRELLRAAYGRTDAELGLPPVLSVWNAQVEAMRTAVSMSRSVGSSSAVTFAEQVQSTRVLDRQLGAPGALDRLKSITEAIESLLTHAVLPGSRAPLAGVLADAGALGGWQALDTGDMTRAWSLYEIAKHAAREADDPAGLAHAMGEQAYALLDIGEPADGLALVDAARTAAGTRVPPVLQAWLAAVAAEMSAGTGDEPGARRLLDLADRTVPADPDETAVLPYIALGPGHLARWRGNILARLGDPDATRDLVDALDQMDPSFTRAGASLRCDLAAAMLAQHERTEARRHAAEGHGLARQAGSVRQRRRIDALAA
jgi:hypothetical protein